MDLSDEEKIFVAHFVLDSYKYVKPVCGRYISLYSFLDQTNETLEQQKIQIENDDWYFSELLRRIFKQSDQATWDSVFKELDKEGFFINDVFRQRFLTVATWLYSKNSLRYMFEAGKQKGFAYAEWKIEQKNNLNEEKKQKDYERRSLLSNQVKKSQAELERDRVNAMKLLYKSTTKGKGANSNNNSIQNWGLKPRPKLVGDGNSWREQS